MPHIVIQSRDVRRSMTDPDGVNREAYQGVSFFEGPSNYIAGEAGQFALELMYYPYLAYADVQLGATFTVREGGKVIAHGFVLSRVD